jgi:hypothetical protein
LRAPPFTPATPAAAPAQQQQQQQQQQHQQQQQQHQHQQQERQQPASPGETDRALDDGAGHSPSQAAAAAPDASTQRNAFDVLARAQRVLQQVHVFFLDAPPAGGRPRARWWLKGGPDAPRDAPDAAWTGSCGLSLGRGGKAQVVIATDLETGDGVEVGWGNPALASNPGGGASSGDGGGAGAGAAAQAGAPGAGGEPRKAVVSLLKSALQKNVRLGRHEQAVRCGARALGSGAGLGPGSKASGQRSAG